MVHIVHGLESWISMVTLVQNAKLIEETEIKALRDFPMLPMIERCPKTWRDELQLLHCWHDPDHEGKCSFDE